jgi:hypothetical protein
LPPTGSAGATGAGVDSRYDSDLERFYTRTTDAQIFRKKTLLLAPS